MGSILDEKVDFSSTIESIKNTLRFLFPMFFREKPLETGKAFVYETKLGSPIQIRSTKNMSNMEMLYGTDVSKGTNFALDSVKVAIKREIYEELMKSDLVEWQYEDTQNGTQITGRLIVNNFNKILT